MAEAEAVLQAAARSRMHAYIVVSLLTGARTEELRALTWDHVDLDGDPDALLPSATATRGMEVGSRWG
jgi:integrase